MHEMLKDVKPCFKMNVKIQEILEFQGTQLTKDLTNGFYPNVNPKVCVQFPCRH